MGAVKGWLMDMEAVCDEAVCEAIEVGLESTSMNDIAERAMALAVEQGVTLSEADAHDLVEKQLTWMEHDLGEDAFVTPR